VGVSELNSHSPTENVRSGGDVGPKAAALCFILVSQRSPGFISVSSKVPAWTKMGVKNMRRKA
jgi:hypothetical protein